MPKLSAAKAPSERVARNHSQTRAREIAETLTRRILEGVYATGDKLPTERELAVEFVTNRNVVREALMRLDAVGLLLIRQGSGIYVQDVQLTSSIKVFDVLMRREDGSINREFLKDVVEFRGETMRAIVRVAAVRRSEEELDEIRRLTRERRACRGNLKRLSDVNERLYRRIAEASHNRVYQYMFNTTGGTQLRLWDVIDLPLIGFEQMQETMEKLVESFEQRDSVLAELLTIRYTGMVREALQLDESPPTMLHLPPVGAAARQA